MQIALWPLAWKRKRERTGVDDSCLPEYEKDCPPSSKGELSEGESFSMLKNSQGAVPLSLLAVRKKKARKETGVSLQAENDSHRAVVFLVLKLYFLFYLSSKSTFRASAIILGRSVLSIRPLKEFD